jgi:hypothetical protein
LLVSYTQDDLHRLIKEARQEWQSQKLF